MLITNLEQKIYIEIVQIQLVILNEISFTYHLFTKISLSILWSGKMMQNVLRNEQMMELKLLLFIPIFIVWSLHYRKKTPK